MGRRIVDDKTGDMFAATTAAGSTPDSVPVLRAKPVAPPRVVALTAPPLLTFALKFHDGDSFRVWFTRVWDRGHGTYGELLAILGATEADEYSAERLIQAAVSAGWVIPIYGGYCPAKESFAARRFLGSSTP